MSICTLLAGSDRDGTSLSLFYGTVSGMFWIINTDHVVGDVVGDVVDDVVGDIFGYIGVCCVSSSSAY